MELSDAPEKIPKDNNAYKIWDRKQKKKRPKEEFNINKLGNICRSLTLDTFSLLWSWILNWCIIPPPLSPQPQKNLSTFTHSVRFLNISITDI
jgi:hypothetical protein